MSARTGKPRPGHGTVTVSPDHLGPGRWVAWWEDDYFPPDAEIADDVVAAGHEDIRGTAEEVLQWARTRPAEHHEVLLGGADGRCEPLPSDPEWRPANEDLPPQQPSSHLNRLPRPPALPRKSPGGDTRPGYGRVGSHHWVSFRVP